MDLVTYWNAPERYGNIAARRKFKIGVYSSITLTAIGGSISVIYFIFSENEMGSAFIFMYSLAGISLVMAASCTLMANRIQKRSDSGEVEKKRKAECQWWINFCAFMMIYVASAILMLMHL